MEKLSDLAKNALLKSSMAYQIRHVLVIVDNKGSPEEILNDLKLATGFFERLAAGQADASDLGDLADTGD